MANDPNRDLLPVKEDSIRYRQAPNERIDHQSVTKLSRCDLEDKVHRLLDEQTQLKKLSNSQEEKIKRLGTKLLRLISEKKNGIKKPDLLKPTEDLQFQLLELEHENYALKDKITVLRQQLANHSRHIAVRSPVRSYHIWPLMSMRQTAPNFQNEMSYDPTNKTPHSDVQLQEAEAHIKELNNEIKALHNKIGYLQQDLEKNSLDNRKTKVTENIEFIRLQRSLKQQATQIAALQAQIKNSENNQNVLKDELLRAHNENDEALHLIAAKQNEILNLCNKLEEENINRLEENDLKQRIYDLTSERDSLKERADLLLKTIEEQGDDSERVKELKMLLAREKLKTKKLEELLGGNTTFCSYRPHSTDTGGSSNCSSVLSLETPPSGVPKKEEATANKNDVLIKKDVGTSPMIWQESKSVQTEADKSEYMTEDNAEKIKMELELQHLREMLRHQTCRCEAQQNEISRLINELKLSEDKCEATLEKLDKRLSAFENLEAQKRVKEPFTPAKRTSSVYQSLVPTKTNSVLKTNQEALQDTELMKTKGQSSSTETVKQEKKAVTPENGSSVDEAFDARTASFQKQDLESILGDNTGEWETEKRFVDQVFLESSDEDTDINVPLQNMSNHKDLTVLQKYESDHEGVISPTKVWSEGRELKVLKPSRMHTSHSVKQKFSPITSDMKFSSDFEMEDKKDHGSLAVKPKFPVKGGLQKLVITIYLLDIDSNSTLWKNDQVKLVFIDFTFLDLHGENTETPESLPKPTIVGQKCEFNFVKEVEITDSRRKVLQNLINKPDLDLLIFKVVSDSEDFDQLTDFECEDVGVAVVTVKQFLEHYNKGFFSIPVKNTEDTNEIIGTLSISFDLTPGLFNPKEM